MLQPLPPGMSGSGQFNGTDGPPPKMGVGVAVGVMVAVIVPVAVTVAVCVAVAVGVSLTVAVAVAVRVGVLLLTLVATTVSAAPAVGLVSAPRVARPAGVEEPRAAFTLGVADGVCCASSEAL